MTDTTKIEWTHHTFNPWWGCARVSPACRSCYADTLATRYGHHVWRRHGERRMLSDENWRKPLRWNRDAEAAGVPARVFCASMADVFEDHPQVAEPRERLWGLIAQTPWLHWQLLTKRIENVAAMAPWGEHWPVNVWLGTSVENQRWAETRIPILLSIPAHIRFLSCEPLLGPIDLSRWLGGSNGVAPQSRGRVVQGGGNRRLEDRRDGARLAVGRTPSGQVDGGDANDSLHAPQGGELYRKVHAGTGDAPRDESARTGSSPCVAPLLRFDSGWADDQSPKRGPGGQPPTESGASDVRRTGTSRTSRSATWATEPVRDAQRDGEALDDRGSGDLFPSGLRGTPPGNRRGLWDRDADGREDSHGPAKISWLICGGESGPRARPTELGWLRSLIEQCEQAGVAAFTKQVGAVAAKALGSADRKGGTPADWPEDLRVRQFPRVAEAVSA